MDTIVVNTVVAVEDDDDHNAEPSQASELPFINYTPESDLLIAEDNLEFGENGDDVLDDILVENATTVVLWTIPVSSQWAFVLYGR